MSIVHDGYEVRPSGGAQRPDAQAASRPDYESMPGFDPSGFSYKDDSGKEVCVGVSDIYKVGDVLSPPTEFQTWKGKTYVLRGRKAKRKEVDLGLPLVHVQEYARTLVNSQIPPSYIGRDEIVMRSVDDWVAQFKAACSHPHSRFQWPSTTFAFQQTWTVALAHCAPGTALVMASGRRIPKRFITDASWQARLKDQNAPVVCLDRVIAQYHGCPMNAVAKIAAEGFQPTAGAGTDAMTEMFRIPVLGAYQANDFITASTYPMAETTKRGVGGTNGCPGGTFIAEDGTMPFRSVWRSIGIVDDRLWQRPRTHQGVDS